jgi:hypothetical protein
MSYLTMTFGSSRARLVPSTMRRAPRDRFPIFAVALSIALLLIALVFTPGRRDIAPDDGALAELRRLGGFDQAKLLGTFDVTPEGRHYTG